MLKTKTCTYIWVNGKVIVSILELCVLRSHMIDLVIFGAKRTICEQKGLPCLFVCQSVNEMRSLNYWDSELCSMRIFCHKFIDIQSKQTNEANKKTQLKPIHSYMVIFEGFFLHIEKYAIFRHKDFYSEHEIRTRFV